MKTNRWSAAVGRVAERRYALAISAAAFGTVGADGMVGVPTREGDGLGCADGGDGVRSVVDLRTGLERGVRWVEYAVETAEALCADRLVKMGWRQVRPGCFVRRLSSDEGVNDIFRRLNDHIELMVLQSARLRPVNWESALQVFVDRMSDAGIGWWLYGSAALAMRGGAVMPGDLDLALEDSRAVGEVMRDLLVEPVSQMSGWVADAGGSAFHGAIIEWLSGAHPTGSSPPHEQEPAAGEHLELVTWRGRSIPVPRLEVQLAVATARDLDERCTLIRHAMSATRS